MRNDERVTITAQALAGNIRDQRRRPARRGVPGIAYHEAGHACVAYLLGAELGPVYLTPLGGGQALFRGDAAELDPPRPAAERLATLDRWVCTLLAGGLAERIGTGQAPQKTAIDQEDLDALGLRVLAIPDLELDAAAWARRVRFLARRTGLLVVLHWPQIDRVAAALAFFRALDGPAAIPRLMLGEQP